MFKKLELAALYIYSKNYTTLECSPSSMETWVLLLLLFFLGSVSPDLSPQWHQPNNVSRPSPMSPPGQWTPWREGKKQPFVASAGQVKSRKKAPTYDPLRKIDCTKCEVFFIVFLVAFYHRIWVLRVEVKPILTMKTGSLVLTGVGTSSMRTWKCIKK